ncbi:MAG: DUF362 domain-containing protein [Deltaproteobacteria bacterium]|nr:DUF362 domain-containing protein [Deltaproteobacteria bacterium]
MDRREFIKRALFFGGSAAMAGGALVYFSEDRENKDSGKNGERNYAGARMKSFAPETDQGQETRDIVIISASNLERNLKSALKELGGIDRFIRKGEKVLLKPNLLLPREPEFAATTNPELVKTLVMICLEAGAAEVAVADNSTGDLKSALEKSGIGEAASEAGARVIEEIGDFIEAEINGVVIKKWKVFREFFEFDRVINVPIIKHHSLSRATAGMKNWFGVLGGERGLLHQDIHGSIVDIASAFKPTLTVVDGIRILMSNGPSGGSLDYVKKANAVILGTDQVALDALSCGYLDVDPSEIGYISMAEKRGLGTADLKKLKIKEII